MTDTKPEGPYKIDSVNGNVVEFCDPTGRFPPIAVSGLHPGTKMVDIENIVNRFFNAGRASREGIMDVARWAGGMDCQNTDKYFGQKPCGVCFSCSARKALAEDEKNG